MEDTQTQKHSTCEDSSLRSVQVRTQGSVRRTSSLWAGVVALCQGVKLVGVVREAGNKAVWLLDDSDSKASAALQDWYTGNPLIGARDMLAARSILLDASLNPDQTTNKE